MDPSQRFWSKVEVRGEDECWPWLAGKTGGGYGVFGIGHAGVTAHRVSWELLHGPIPPGLHIDHLCRNILYVNPAHLEPVTVAENNRRRAAAMTHCKNGHPWDTADAHYVTPVGHRQCRACRLAHDRRRVAARSAAVAARKATRKECANGHPWIAANLYTSPRGYVTCRVCGRERQRAYKMRRAKVT